MYVRHKQPHCAFILQQKKRKNLSSYVSDHQPSLPLLQTDFALIVLRDMLRVYPALKVVLMSATIDTSLFSNYFNDCPVLEIPEKIFTVQGKWPGQAAIVGSGIALLFRIISRSVFKADVKQLDNDVLESISSHSTPHPHSYIPSHPHTLTPTPTHTHVQSTSWRMR